MGHTICEATAVMNCESNIDHPELQLMALPAGVSSDFGTALKGNLHLSDEVSDFFLRIGFFVT